MIRAFVLLVALAAQVRAARADDLQPEASTMSDADSPLPTIEVHGMGRVRAGYLYNLDLDRGLTPSGQPLFPVPDASSQTTDARDVRLRTDLALRSRGGAAELHLRLDVFDDVGLGATSFDAASGRATDTGDNLKLRRAYGAVLTPVGVLIAGRTPNQFGLGLVANPGDCLDCDGGDFADRVGLATPVRGFVAVTSLDLSSSANHFATQHAADPRDNPHAVTFALMRWHGDAVRAIRRRGGRTTVDYGAAGVYVWQDKDTPADYLLPNPGPMPATMVRGLSAFVTSAWLRVETPRARVEAEGALVSGQVEQGSLIPGLLLRQPVEMLQHGLAIESELGAPTERFGFGIDAGYASGDPAPGFGAFPSLDNASAQRGDLDGVQIRPPGDLRVDNFRFNPNYRIDYILFRQIIGTVTDAAYLRPHVRFELGTLGPGVLTARFASVASWAIEPDSTPSGKRSLGVELDSQLAYGGKDGFVAQLVHAVLFPGAAFDGAMLAAHPAQTIELLMGYTF